MSFSISFRHSLTELIMYSWKITKQLNQNLTIKVPNTNMSHPAFADIFVDGISTSPFQKCIKKVRRITLTFTPLLLYDVFGKLKGTG